VRAAVALHRAGYHVVRLNVRGAGASMPDAPLLYHAGLTEDPRVACELVARMPGVAGVAIVGFSLGGNTALKLAAEWRTDAPKEVRAIATISAPLDLDAVGTAMERMRTLPYRRYVLRSLVRQGTAFARLHPERAHYDARLLPRVRTIRQYDDVVVTPMHGFASTREYYERASAGPTLRDVRVPTLIIHAEDDPMVPGASVRPWLRDASASIDVAWSRRGGHVGWIAGLTESRWVNTWAVDRALEFLRRVT
jgi:predicted alpha/beta-fold hydrolase